MKTIANWSAKYKILLPAFLILATLIIGVPLLRYYQIKNKYYEIVNMAERNKALCQQITFYVSLIDKGNEEVKPELQNAIIAYDQALTIIKDGGIVPNKEVTIPPADDIALQKIATIEQLWKEYKLNLQKIISESSIIIETVGETNENDSTNVEQTKTLEIANPIFTTALKYITDTNTNLLAVNDDLIIYYNQLQITKQSRFLLYIAIFALLIAIIAGYGVYFLRKHLATPLQKIEKALDLLALGNIKFKLKQYNSVDEIGSITESVVTVKEKLTEKLNFILQVTKGEYNAEYQLDSDDDEVGKALLEMQKSFQTAAEEEHKRKEEDRRQNQITQGLAKLSEILRQDNDNMGKLSFNIISYLVSFLDANQGGIFVINDANQQDVHVELTASVAFNKRKYLQRRIEIGEGLVGRCIMEQKTIYMTELPDEYIEITSGLGGATPRFLVIVPLKFNESIFGVIEIASFKEFLPYQIEFVERVAESIASTISSVRISLQTALLLKESQKQAERMAQQEIEMRKNMTELEAIQREARMQEEKLVSFTNSVNHTMIRAEFEANGKLIYANTRFIRKLDYNASIEVEGRHLSMFIDPKDRAWFDTMWEPLSKGGKHFEGNMKLRTKNNRDIWLIATFTAVRNAQNEIEKILFLGIDTTDQKEESLDHKGQIDALDNTSMKIEYAPNGKIVRVNKLVEKVLGYSEVELEGKTAFDFIDKKDLAEFKIVWDNAINGIPYKGDVKRFSQSGDEKWLHATYTAVRDMYNNVAKVIFIANEITEQKKLEEELRHQTEELKAQEEELRQNLEELATTQEEMSRKQHELEILNQQMRENEHILKQALQSAKEREEEIDHKNKQLAANEEELTQSLEEMQTVHEDMQRKQQDLENAQRKLQSNDTVLRKAIERLKEKEKEAKERESRLSASEEELRQNLEELQATQEAMLANQAELEDAKHKLQMNETNLQRALEQANLKEQEANEKALLLASSEEELRQNLEELHATQEDMILKQQELETAKERLEANEAILKKAATSAKLKATEAKEMNALLAASEEELRQNLEELQATQEAMQDKQKELELTKSRLESNETVLKKAVTQQKTKEHEFKEKIKAYEKTENDLRQKLEELSATHDALQKKQDEIESTKKELVQDITNKFNNEIAKLQESLRKKDKEIENLKNKH